MSETEERALVVETDRGDFTPRGVAQAARAMASIAERGGEKDRAADLRLTLALALMVERLAEARRVDLGEVVERVKDCEAALWRLGESAQRAETEAQVEESAPLLAETTETKAFAQRVAARFETRAGKLPTVQDDEAYVYRECARILRGEVGL